MLDRNQREMNGDPINGEEEADKGPQYFQGKSTSLGMGAASGKVQYDPTGGSNDPDLLKAIQMSMKDVKNEFLSIFDVSRCMRIYQLRGLGWSL